MNVLRTIRSEKGTALIVAVLVLIILTVIGLAATTTSTIDLQITQNQRDYVQEFYVADSGWKTAANWLNSLGGSPSEVNTSGNIVRNFGNGGEDVLNDTFPDATEDATMNGVAYWYRVTYVQDQIAPGSGGDYRRFLYTTTSNANRAQEIEVALTKIYKVGYQ